MRNFKPIIHQTSRHISHQPDDSVSSSAGEGINPKSSKSMTNVMRIVFLLLAVLLISCASFLSGEQEQPVDDTTSLSVTIPSTSTPSPPATETVPTSDQTPGDTLDDTPTLAQASDSIAGIQPNLDKPEPKRD